MITNLYSAFPATGKTHIFKSTTALAIDSDSSQFDKSKFPENYIEHIKENIGKIPIIFISSHKEVRDALVENNLDFTLVYPDKSLKQEYIDRFRERGDDEGFIELVSNNWDDWMEELENQKECEHIVLKAGEFLSDRIHLTNDPATKK